MSEFKIGEVARLVRYNEANSPSAQHHLDCYFGTDVTVCSAPKYAWKYIGGVGYEIATHDGISFDVGVVCLRKIQPPPNWIKICKLDEVPVDATPSRVEHVMEFAE